jgi:hypothetical protein
LETSPRGISTTLGRIRRSFLISLKLLERNRREVLRLDAPKKDLENVSVPALAELPQHSERSFESI